MKLGVVKPQLIQLHLRAVPLILQLVNFQQYILFMLLKLILEIMEFFFLGLRLGGISLLSLTKLLKKHLEIRFLQIHVFGAVQNEIEVVMRSF